MDVADLSMPALADRMGVSVQALYRHVSGRHEVLKLLNRQVLATMEPPPLDRRHWSEWLLDYARAWRRVLLQCPSRVSRIDFGTKGAEGLLEHAERVLEVLAAAGFSDDEGLKTFSFLGRMVFGWVYWELEYQAATRGEWGLLSPLSRPYRTFAVKMVSRPPSELPIMRRLEWDAWSERVSEESFDEYVRTLLTGIAVRRGESHTRFLGRAEPRVKKLSSRNLPRSGARKDLRRGVRATPDGARSRIG
jgi:AcrR family transcriptional regulator